MTEPAQLIEHRMKLSIRKNSQLVVWCTCMAQTNDQLGHPDKAGDPRARVEWRFWAFDYIAIIPIDQPAGPVFRMHVLEAQRLIEASPVRRGEARSDTAASRRSTQTDQTLRRTA